MAEYRTSSLVNVTRAAERAARPCVIRTAFGPPVDPEVKMRRNRSSAAQPAAEDLFLLIFTSGSTGGPKAVRMTQGRAARSAARVTFTSDDVLYSAMPLFHGNALIASVLPAFASGATLVLRRRF